MSWICEEYKKAIEERVEEPIKERIKKKKKKCKKKKCKKWCLCCNKWKCWVEVFFETVIRWIITIIVKWVVYVVCKIVTTFLDALANLLGIIGWILERIIGLPELILCGLGKAQGRKHLSLSVFVWEDEEGNPVVPLAEVQRKVQEARAIFLAECNIEIHPPKRPLPVRDPIEGADAHKCGVRGWFSWKKSVYDSLAFPGTVAAVFVRSIPGNSVGCHIPGTDYVLVASDASLDSTLAHELGHAGDLWRHRNKTPDNLMCSAGVPRTGTNLTKWQRCVVRTSNIVGWLAP